MSKVFKIGDKVVVIDDDIEGKVVAVIGDDVAIETPEGFNLTYKANELLKKKKKVLEQNALKGFSKAIVEKNRGAKKRSVKIKPKERKLPPMEVDLHIHQLVASERGLTSHDKKLIQLDTAQHKLEFAMKNNIQRIVFIHGVGDGVLKLELHYLFKRYDNVSFQDADYRKYGMGATEVYIHQNPKKETFL